MQNTAVNSWPETLATQTLHAALWRCDKCDSYIAIHSPQMVETAICPLCGDVPLGFCGSFQNILGLQFADA
jgi:uncharacterized paraquat-inducible protein A